jgi:DNA modification methylase
MTPKKARKLAITYEPLDDLARRSDPGNPKAHDLRALDASFDRFGYADPVAVNDTTNTLLAGHGRIEALLLLRARGEGPPAGIEVDGDGAWLMPVVHGIALTEEDARAYLVAANRLVELGGWDPERLSTLLGELASTGRGLEGVGYSLAELDALLASLGREPRTEPDPDDVPELPAPSEQYVQRGQTWRLGAHRLRCGDATNDEDVAALLGAEKAILAVTDPPYNVDYGNHGGAGGGRHRAIANDALDPEAWERFLTGWTKQLVDNVVGALYIFMSSREWPSVCKVLAGAGAHWSDTIIWSKDQFTLGRADYQRQFEPIWYGWRKRAKRHWCGDRAQGDVWSFPRPRSSQLHPTMKPVALIERAIANSSPRGGIVLDLFAGSGTTIVAAERQGRSCYALELDPGYAQVSIERWKRFTGRDAQLEEDNVE